MQNSYLVRGSILLAVTGLALSGCVSAPFGGTRQEQRAITAVSGKKTSLVIMFSATKDCKNTYYTYPETIRYPDHGNISFEVHSGRPKAITEGSSPACRQKSVEGAVVFYRSDPGFVGSDRATFRRPGLTTDVAIKVVK
ncbi:hypothetical protein MOV66_13435 [Agrobacterium sp. SHOUNA12C]|uniref:hypothetical protein n=1 Tax=Rhizobium TaxID=379 RepID=UPI00103E599D|nr:MULTISPECIES: hypothetical protein [Rhizobium]MCJ9720958.1 hypothetical protein [Agrobacterium sp. BETTINA12B]MCJ9757647.1 hypothetical protein [Agrobacterium sp. SHOUNA12C]MDJ1638110.1 hypothetical protein [Rhizobium rhizogenes]NTF47596.1 hypothetical protein [Rhizobium rhizogenes]NTF54092.1 hypothetical protein [Rhizobium rhizogenes]